MALEQAAKELAIPAQAMEILIELGRIRVSIHLGPANNFLIVQEEDIPVDIFNDAKITEQVISSYSIAAPEFLYVPAYFLKMGSIHANGSIVTNSYQTFDGDDVQLFDPRGLPAIQNHGPVNTVKANASFSTEEIERYKRTQIHELFVFRDRSNYTPFKLPLKVEPAAEAMVDLGNRYYKEYGCVPTGPALFRKYMCQNHDQPWEVIDRPNGRRGEILIESKPISYESFNKRFRQYQENNGR